MKTTPAKTAPLPRTRLGDPAWEFRAAEGFLPEPRFAFMFDLLSESPDAYARILEYEKASPDKEDFWRCVLRERAVEIRACAEYGVPYFFCVERTDGNRLLNALGPAERAFSKFEFYDPSFRKADVAGYEFFVRTHAKSGPVLAAALRKAWGRASVVETSETLSDWPEKILPEFLWRKVGTFRLWDLRGDRGEATSEKVLSEHASRDGSVFIKSGEKWTSGLSKAWPLALYDVFWWAVETLPWGTSVIVSEPMPVSARKGVPFPKTLEYRCYCVRGELNSVSAYHDYERFPVPRAVSEFAVRFVSAHRKVLGPKATYVFDVCECDDGRIRLVETNGAEGAWRYLWNRADSLVTWFASDGKFRFSEILPIWKK